MGNSQDYKQGSDFWFKSRCGKITASRIADVMATIKSGESASRANYRAELVAERLTGSPAESYSNSAMQWGTETEPLARLAYEAYTGSLVEEVGFIDHPYIDLSGASPDGLVDDGLVEIKCPNTSTHIGHLLKGEVPSKYKPQMAWQCCCTGRNWCDFVSFDPRMPERHQLLVVRYIPEDSYLIELEQAVRKFSDEVNEVIKQLELR